MGRIRTKDIKDLARDLHEVYGERFSPDFEQNKSVMGELKIVEGKSKRFRNRVAGYIVRLARQAAHGHHAAGERAPEPAAPLEAEIVEAVQSEAAQSEEASAQESEPSEEVAEESGQEQETEQAVEEKKEEKSE